MMEGSEEKERPTIRRANKADYDFVANWADDGVGVGVFYEDRPSTNSDERAPTSDQPINLPPGSEGAQGLPFDFAQPPTAQIEEASQVPLLPKTEKTEFDVTDANAQKPRPKASWFTWGAALGTFTSTSAIALYLAFSATTGEFKKQLLRPTIDLSSNDGLRIFGNYSIFIASTAVLFGLINLAYRFHQSHKKTDFDEEAQPDPATSPDNINLLYYKAVNTKALNCSKNQKRLFVAAFIVFVIANAFYCYNTFRDIADEARKLLPNYGISMYKFLNHHAGWVAAIMNFGLNQWFFCLIGSGLIHTYNEIQLIQKPYKSSKNVSNKQIGVAIGIGLLAIIASIPFIALANDDDKVHGVTKGLNDLAAVLVYGAVLNTVGAKQLVSELSIFWNWLNRFPEPLIEKHNLWKQSKGYVLGHALWNINRGLGECWYLLSKNYYGAFFYPYQRGDYKKPEITITEIQEKVEERIRNPELTDQQSNLSDLERHIRQITAVNRKLLDQKGKEIETRSDIWEHGYVRHSLNTVWNYVGPIGLTVVLVGYYSAINKAMTNLPLINLNENDADTKILTFLLFLPFIKLVHTSGYNSMDEIFKGMENKVSSLYHFGTAPMPYIREIGWNPKTKIFAIATVFFALKAAAFLTAPPSAGTVVELLHETSFIANNPSLFEFTKHDAYWFTALFNSLGIAAALSVAQSWLTDRFLSSNQRKTLRENDRFFKVLKTPRGLLFNPEDLSHDKVTNHVLIEPASSTAAKKLSY